MSKNLALTLAHVKNSGIREGIDAVCEAMARRAGREQEFRRWPKFKAQYLRTAQHIIDDKPDSHYFKRKFRSGQEYFDWWMQDRTQEEADDNQMDMWEE